MSSPGEAGIALNNLYPERRLFALTPQPSSMPGAIQERATIGPLAALDGTGDTYELGFQQIAGNSNHCITVATHVHEGNVRRQIRVGHSPCLIDVAGPPIFQARLDPVSEQ